MQRETVGRTFWGAFRLCVFCSAIVSIAAVGLRSTIQANKERERKKNILIAAGLYDETEDVEDQFKQVQIRIVNLKTGEYTDAVQVGVYDQRKASKDPDLSKPLDRVIDVATIKRLEKYAYVYLVDHEDGPLIVLPIRGYGLWSTLRGFLAIDFDTLKQSPDATLVRGITYYEHAETPGLGGEVDNPAWKAKWQGKKLFDDEWKVTLRVVKGATGEHEVDALSGATITSRGVDNMLKFWLGENGFGPYLKAMRTEAP